MSGIKSLLIINAWYLYFSCAAFGQSETFVIPEKLSSSVNTSVEETLPILSPSGDTLYFTRFNLDQKSKEPVKGHDIWYTVKTSNGWTEAKNDLLNLEAFNSVVGISADGQTLFLLKYEGKAYSSLAGIAYSEKIDGKWQAPQPWDAHEIFTANSFFGFFLNQQENVLIISMKGINALGKEDLYVSFKNPDRTWSAPRHMGPMINSRGFEISPFLCADNRTLYFSSNGHGGLGDADIFVTYRLDDHWNNWSEPKNLGKPVNSAGFDGYFTRYNNHDIFFVSNRGAALTDIYHTAIADESSEQHMLATNDLTGKQNNDGRSEDGVEINSSISGNKQNDANRLNDHRNAEGNQGTSNNRNKVAGNDDNIANNGNNTTENRKKNTNGEYGSSLGNGTNDLDGNSRNNEDKIANGFNATDDITANMITGAVIYFGFDVSTLTQAAQSDLLKVVETLKDEKKYSIALVGYTDQSGSQRYNLKLSKKRAKAARDFLVANGLDKAMITDEGKGIYLESPADLGEESRRLQRRVDIKYEIIDEN